MNKVIRMTEEIWNLPSTSGALNRDGSYCALGKIALALGLQVPNRNTDYEGHGNVYNLFDKLAGYELPLSSVFSINDTGRDLETRKPIATNHELAIRTGIEMLLAAGCTLETDDTVSRELARIKACAEVV